MYHILRLPSISDVAWVDLELRFLDFKHSVLINQIFQRRRNSIYFVVSLLKVVRAKERLQQELEEQGIQWVEEDAASTQQDDKQQEPQKRL